MAGGAVGAGAYNGGPVEHHPHEESVMKRWIVMIALTSLTVLPALCATDAWARAGGGGSSGSRGSRSYSAPSSPGAAPMSPARPSPAPPSSVQQSPQRSGWGAGIGGMLGGLVLGGLIGSLLFGGMGQMSGGIGLLEIVAHRGARLLRVLVLPQPPGLHRGTRWVRRSGRDGRVLAPGAHVAVHRGPRRARSRCG